MRLLRDIQILTLLATQFGQRLRSGEAGLMERVVPSLRRVATRLRQGLPPFESVWPEPPEGLLPSDVVHEHRAEYVGTMLDRVSELAAVAASCNCDWELLARARRIVHSMKALAASVGDDTTAWYCHHVEARLRNSSDAPSATACLFGELKGQSDTLRQLIEDPKVAFARLRFRVSHIGETQTTPLSLRSEEISAQRSFNSLALDTRVEPPTSFSPPAQATFERVFVRCERAAKRFAEAEGKSVSVEMVGGELEVEDDLGERLIEPLLQIVKNAISHGIELPQERRRKGKPIEGLLRLSVERHLNGVRVLIEDDGAGVDLELVRRRAIERKLSTEAEALRLADDELFGLLFVPGLSTRAHPNLLSGRGMGLDLSLDVVRRLGGLIRLSARTPAGVCVAIELP
ncbi:MAG: ATP-binding protein [Polyangiaceae bacterium]